MDIGSKLKNARLKTNLTQEQIAESLGVSRQTISNWENEKTYPDIISVIKLSDLYHVSLDYLLKEEKDMWSYLDYLEEGTNTVKSNNRKEKMMLICVYLAIWGVGLIVFLFMDPTDIMGYDLLFSWLLFPLMTFVFSLMIGKNNYWGRGKWLSVIIFGMMYMLSECLTFGFKYEDFSRVNIGRFYFAAFISLVGLVIGCSIRYMDRKKREKR